MTTKKLNGLQNFNFQVALSADLVGHEISGVTVSSGEVIVKTETGALLKFTGTDDGSGEVITRIGYRTKAVIPQEEAEDLLEKRPVRPSCPDSETVVFDLGDGDTLTARIHFPPDLGPGHPFLQYTYSTVEWQEV